MHLAASLLGLVLSLPPSPARAEQSAETALLGALPAQALPGGSGRAPLGYPDDALAVEGLLMTHGRDRGPLGLVR